MALLIIMEFMERNFVSIFYLKSRDNISLLPLVDRRRSVEAHRATDCDYQHVCLTDSP